MTTRKNVVCFSEALSLALHAMALLARHPDRRLTTRQIAMLLGASQHHLAKVFQRLVSLGLVDSTVGPSGGFRLKKPAEEIALLEICEAIQRPADEPGCLLTRLICNGPQDCLLGTLLESINDQMRKFLARCTLAELAGTVDLVELSTT